MNLERNASNPVIDFSDDELELGGATWNVRVRDVNARKRRSSGKVTRRKRETLVKPKALAKFDLGQEAKFEDASSEDFLSPPAAKRRGRPRLYQTNPKQPDKGELSPAPCHHIYPPRKYFEVTHERYNFPSIRSHGPGDLWTCGFRGCSFREHETSTPDGLGRIRSHLATTADHLPELISVAPDNSPHHQPIEYVFSPKPRQLKLTRRKEHVSSRSPYARRHPHQRIRATSSNLSTILAVTLCSVSQRVLSRK